ncbi:uncharacterized protein EI90DRAFT_3017603 [Cantharellus anzutake]|uniref:uncharacterized protein n=1 Tax=Cantharellus anzutake TaxID=1750568 RepID=UPI0019033273|nr:uncharacterized protein EI90DRAFT_3017603 [Cantharellus anzutake]KAF8328546.1 hypothetical protein EI90DRAFT_3017603 [Cantharellus anzutake]
MPRALQLLNILAVLFDCCPNTTLASAAQTCKLWWIPALQRLWRVLDTPLPLLLLLGKTDRWDTRRYVSNSMDLDALPRVQFYAQFVQCISVRISRRSDIHLKLLSEFTQVVQFLHPHLFPHLTSLDLTSSDCYSNGPQAIRIACAWLATCPPKISLSFLDSQCPSVIRSLIHHGASLTSLSLHIDMISRPNGAVEECFVSSLKPLVNLACLTADQCILFTSTVWTCIAQLPNLKEVHSPKFVEEESGADAPDPSTWHSLEPSTFDTPFPSLHTIEMAVPSQLAVIVLGYYPLDGVRFLRLLLTDDENDLPTEQSLIQIVTICKGLHELLLVAPDFSLPVLKLPLSPNLTYLMVCTNDVETITNAELVDLCSKMPNLEELGLIPVEVDRNDDPPGLTLEVIRSIAGVCPRLERASLYINTDVSGIQFSFDDPPFPSNHPLSTLCFAPSPVRNRSEVAAYLCTVFPDARRAPTIMAPRVSFQQHFSWGGPHHHDPEEEWKCVSEFMDKLRRRVIPCFRSRLEQMGAELEALRKKS